MPGWLFELSGDAAALKQLVAMSCPPSWSVRREGESFFLRCAELDTLSEMENPYGLADSDMLPFILNAATACTSGFRFSTVKLYGRVIFEDAEGQRKNHHPLSGHIVISSSASGELSGGRPAVGTGTSMIEISTAKRGDPRVRQALHHFAAANQESWTFELYKVIELIAVDVGEVHLLSSTGKASNPGQAKDQGMKLIVANSWATAQEMEGFRAVHDPTLTGMAARHAVQTQKAPTVPISTQAAATGFVKRVLEAWVRQK